MKVDEILDNSDAYRRGLRYGDQIVEFAGREITTANRLKNALGIFPRGWPVPLTYRRADETFETIVRLMGVHDQSQLYDLVQRQDFKPPEPTPKKPLPEDEQPNPIQQLKDLIKKKPRLPKAIADRYEARRGYANYWYNEQKQLSLWDDYEGREVLAQAGAEWKLTGGSTEITIDASKATITRPNAVSGATFEADLSSQLSPPGSGGLLLTLHLWQRMIDKGLKKFGEVYYLGQLPSGEDGRLLDCLVGIYAGIETCFQFDTQSGELVGIVMLPREGLDPCELELSNYGELSGRVLPRTWKVFYGEELYMEAELESWEFSEVSTGDSN